MVLFLRSIFLLVSCSMFTAVLSQSGYYKFTENKGQFPEQVLFSTEIENGIIFFEKDRFTYNLRNSEDLARVNNYHGLPSNGDEDWNVRGHAYQVVFKNSQTDEIIGEKSLKGTTNYFLTKNQSTWASGCKSFKKIIYQNLYPGVDLHVFANDFILKFEYHLAAGVNPVVIQQVYEGIEQLKIKDKKIQLKTNAGLITENAPISYQKVDGFNEMVPSEYEKSKNVISYKFPDGIDLSKPLVIDPELVFSTYSGSFSNNFGYTATFDNDGFLYAGSSAFGNDYPTTLGSYDEVFNLGTVDMALSKLDTTGTFLVWSTYLGGDNEDLPHSIMVNENDELYVLGTSGSSNYPTTTGAISSDFSGGVPQNFGNGLGVNYDQGSDIVISRLSADGTQLLSSTYIGGSHNDGLNYGSDLKYNYADEIRGEIQLDEFGNVFVVSSTYSDDFPVSNNAFQQTNGGEQDAVAFMLSPDLTNLEWSTYVGGSASDAGYSLTFDSQGDVIICGGTLSSDLAVTTNAFQGAYGGAGDGFICSLTSGGSASDYLSFYGTDSYDQVYFTETDSEDKLYVFGQTEHTDSDFIINAAYSTVGGGQIVSKFDETFGNLEWSTAFGTGEGEPNISPTAFLVDVCDRIYLSGWGGNTGGGDLSTIGMDVTADAFKSVSSTGDFYLMVLLDDASDIFYGSFYGGDQSNEHVDGGTSRFSRKGQIYQAVCAGCGSNDDFPIEPITTALSPQNNSSCNLGMFKFDFQIPTTIADFNVPDQICANQPFTINNQSIFSQNFTWNFGDGSPVQNTPNPTHQYEEPGVYEITLSVSSLETCNGTDQISRTVVIDENEVNTEAEVSICAGQAVQIGPTETNEDFTYTWTPDVNLSSTEIANPVASPLETTEYILSVERGACIDTLFQTVEVEILDYQVTDDQLLCENGTVDLNVQTTQEITVTWSNDPDFSNVINDSPTDLDIAPLITETSTYYVQVTGENCTAEEEVEITVFNEFVELEGNVSICAGDTVEVNTTQDFPNTTYQWEPAEAIVSGQGTSSVQVAADTETVVSVLATSGICTAEDEITVSVINDFGTGIEATATPPTIISGGESQLNVNIPDVSYTWTPSQSLNNSAIQSPLATPDETTIYTVTAGIGDCSQTTNVRVTVVDFVCGPPLIFVPNVFSPNADDTNDKLFVYGQNLTDINFAIFNRWGQKVFETFDQSVGWDGTFEGKEVSPAVFDYYLEAKCAGGEDYFEKGNITLVR